MQRAQEELRRSKLEPRTSMPETRNPNQQARGGGGVYFRFACRGPSDARGHVAQPEGLNAFAGAGVGGFAASPAAQESMQRAQEELRRAREALGLAEQVP